MCIPMSDIDGEYTVAIDSCNSLILLSQLILFTSLILLTLMILLILKILWILSVLMILKILLESLKSLPLMESRLDLGVS